MLVLNFGEDRANESSCLFSSGVRLYWARKLFDYRGQSARIRFGKYMVVLPQDLKLTQHMQK